MDDDYYGRDHLKDLVAARRYADADVVGTQANFVYLANGDATVSHHADKQEDWGRHLRAGRS